VTFQIEGAFMEATFFLQLRPYLSFSLQKIRRVVSAPR
jgi:hypothetical protein